MRVSFYAQPSHIPPIAPSPVQAAPPAPAQFLPFSAEAFQQARTRDVPVLLFISDAPPTLSDAALSMQIAERTVPVWLYPGMRPDVELLCQRAGALFSEEGALPLCALMLEDARVFLAAPLPPAGFALDPSRLYVWLSQADRRFAQNRDAFIRQAVQTLRSFRAEPLRKPYSPHDAAHDLVRALSAVHDPINGGFGKLKQPLCPALRFLSRAAIGSHQARTALDQTLEAMLASDLYDPLDGAFFRATLTEDWRVFVPEKPLAWPFASNYPLTDSFVNRISPITGRPEKHTGLDIGAPYGTTVLAAADGVVLISEFNTGGYGNYVVINHGGGVSTLYGHHSVNLVSAGTTVKKGDPIARVGSTGYSTGPHLHFEVRINGVPQNPLNYL